MGFIRLRRWKNRVVSFMGGVLAAKSAIKKIKHKNKAKQGKLSLQRKEVITMKKSTFAAILVFLSAAVGALVAAYMYIQRREKELDEYEQLLFSEEFNQTVPSSDEEETHEVPAPEVEEAEEIELNFDEE